MMKNKISYSNKIALLIFLCLGALLYTLFAKAQTETTTFDLSELRLKNNFSTIHFNAGGNDFGGGALWVSTQKKLTTPKIIQTATGAAKSCFVQLEGFYYNSQRGERLWPLDQSTLEVLKKSGTEYADLSLDGGLYTSCGTGDAYSIYGNVEHHLPGEPKYFLAAGVNYVVSKNRIQENSPLNCTLQLVNNKTAVGYLYDYQGGIGFVGGQVPSPSQNELLAELLTSGSCINDLFQPIDENNLSANIGGSAWTISNENSLENLKWNLAIRGIVGFTNDVLLQDKVNVEGGFGQKSQTVRTTALSLANAVNVARRKGEQLCRGKRNKNTGTIRCFNQESGSTRKLVLTPGTTYVFQDVDVELSEYMNNNPNTEPVSVFIDGGTLQLPSSVNTGTLIGFNDDGYPAEYGVVRQGNFLKGNFIVNGILIPSASEEGQTGIQNKLYLHGKLLSLNTFDTPSEVKLNQISQLLGDGSFDKKWVDFRELFLWNCQNPVAGIANDGTPCKGGVQGDITVGSLAIIDMNFPSPLMN